MQDLSPKGLFAGRYRLRKRLGQGGFSEAWLAHNEVAGNQQVVKLYNTVNEQGHRLFHQDYARVLHLRHSGLLLPNYYDIQGNRPYLILPYCHRGSTARLAGKLGEREVARVMRDIGSALAYIHQPAYKFVHRAIKPENILLSDRGHYLLADFGLSLELRQHLSRQAPERHAVSESEVAGRLQPYLAPECAGEEGVSRAVMASDVWALGATLFELAAGHPPFGEWGGEAQRTASGAPALPEHFSVSIGNILNRCLAPAPQARLTAESLRQAAETYLDTGEWPEQYTSGDNPGWTSRDWEVPSIFAVSPTALGIAALVALLLGVVVWFWPSISQPLAGEQETVAEAVRSEPEAAPPQLPEQKQPAPAGKEEGAVAEAPFDLSVIPGVLPAGDGPAASDPFEVPLPVEELVPQPKQADIALPSAVETVKEAETPAKLDKEPQKTAAARPSTPRPRLNELTGKWGYVDDKGEWVIWPQFDQAAPFREGKARVAREESSGELRFYYLKKDGELTPAPETEQ